MTEFSDKVADLAREHLVCAAFLLCQNPAVGTFTHPVLGEVPSCQRCADKLGETLDCGW